MSEESLSPEAQNEPPTQPVDDQPPSKEDKGQAPETGATARKQEIASGDKSPAVEGKSPAVKRNVRGTKKTSAKKAAKSGADKKADETSQPDEGKPGRRGRGRQGKSAASESRLKLDEKKVAKRAWKIFLGEVGEEGLALIADKDARELARRSLKIAEIYSREEAALLEQNKGKKSS